MRCVSTKKKESVLISLFFLEFTQDLYYLTTSRYSIIQEAFI